MSIENGVNEPIKVEQLVLMTPNEVRTECHALPKVAIACFNRLKPEERGQAMLRGVELVEAADRSRCTFVSNLVEEGQCMNHAYEAYGDEGKKVITPASSNGPIRECPASIWLAGDGDYQSKPALDKSSENE